MSMWASLSDSINNDLIYDISDSTLDIPVPVVLK